MYLYESFGEQKNNCLKNRPRKSEFLRYGIFCSKDSFFQGKYIYLFTSKKTIVPLFFCLPIHLIQMNDVIILPTLNGKCILSYLFSFFR